MYELEEFRAKIRAEKRSTTYDDLLENYPVNRWHLWMLINDDDYRPSREVCEKLGIVHMVEVQPCAQCGHPHLIEGVCPEEGRTEIRYYEGEPPGLEYKRQKSHRPNKSRPRPSYKRLWQQSLLLLALVVNKNGEFDSEEATE